MHTHTLSLTHTCTHSHTYMYRSLSGLGRYVSTLEARRRRRTDKEQRGDDPAEIENGRSLEAESEMNGLPEESDKDCDVIQPAQSEDSASGDRTKVDDSMTMDVSASRGNLNSLAAEDMSTASMEGGESKNRERRGSEERGAGVGREEGEELDPSETSSKRPKRRSSSTAKHKVASRVCI